MPAPARQTVWVVDDSRLDAERAKAALGGDYEVVIFNDGSAALERLSGGESPYVMVLDWVMPGVSGLDVCRFLRAAHTHGENIGLLLLTVHRNTEQVVEGLTAGANDYLAKPYQDEELRARVAALVRTRQLLDRLALAEAENRRLLETAPDPLLVTDEDGRLTFVNEGAARMLERPRDGLLGLTLAELVPELARNLTDHAPEATQPLPDVNIGARRFSPTRRTFGIGDSSTIVSLRDVTERRLIEERRLDFYSIIAHDLRTPLNAMTLRLASMLERSREKPLADMAPDLRKLEERLGSLVSMINDFLDLASLEGASYRIERSDVDLLHVLDKAREDLTPLLERGGHTFAGPTLQGGASTVVPGDERRLIQVLSNLISNAVKFMPQPGTVRAFVRAEDQFVEVVIEDSGSGISEAAQARLFQRYARAERTVGGTGLGLLIVREVIEAHGGIVGVESEEGRGSRFWFRLPRARGVQLLA